MSRILVIGGSGQIGSDLKYSKVKRNNKFIFPSSDELDITRKKSISEFLKKNKVDLVLNFAAYTNVDKAEVEKKRANNINNKGALNLSIETLKHEIGLIHFSTDYVFGKNNSTTNHYDDKVSPVNHYGYTKSEGEKAILLNSYLGFIVRLASVYGVYGNNFIKTIAKLLLTSNEIKVVSDQKISLTSSFELVNNIDYLIDLYNKNINNDGYSPKIIHFTNKGYTNWYNVAKIIKSELQLILNKRINTNLVPIKSREWVSLAKRPLDSRLKVDFNELERNNIFLPKWEISVRDFVRKIFPTIKNNIENDGQ